MIREPPRLKNELSTEQLNTELNSRKDIAVWDRNALSSFIHNPMISLLKQIIEKYVF